MINAAITFDKICSTRGLIMNYLKQIKGEDCMTGTEQVSRNVSTAYRPIFQIFSRFVTVICRNIQK